MDNTPQGAAFRIKKMLEGFRGYRGVARSDGVCYFPKDYKEQIMEKGAFEW